MYVSMSGWVSRLIYASTGCFHMSLVVNTGLLNQHSNIELIHK